MASSQMPSTHLLISPKSSSSTSLLIPNSFLKPLLKPTHLRLNLTQIPLLFRPTNPNPLTFSAAKTRAAIDEASPETDTTLLLQEEKEAEKGKPTKEVEESVKVLKNAAKTRRVAPGEILSAFSVLEKAKLDPSGFLETLGGTKSPGRTWMLVFTAEKALKSGKYFPLTAVQRFDAAGKKIENGVYLGSLGCLTFEGRLSWKKRILAFIFERIRIKIGPFNPFEVQFGGKDEREPSTKDPFFIWFYIDEEIAVARGRSGGTAFWVRCRRVPTY